MPLEKAIEREKKIKKNAKKKGNLPSKLLLSLCSWNIYFTNVLQEELSIEEVIAFYRTRWTIELLFKQFKSVIKINESNHKNEFRLQCEIYGKLIVICFIHLLYGKMNSYYLVTKNKELSFEKLYKFLNNKAYKIYELILAGNKYIFKFIYDNFVHIISRCIKFYQPSRKTSLQNLFLNFKEKS